MRVGHLRRNSIVLGATTAVLGLLFLYPTSTNRVGGPAAPAASAGVVSTVPGHGGQRTTVVNGQSALTRYGPVQLQVTINSSRITAVKTLTAPSSGDRDRAISAFALPILQREALTAQSATIDTVSGATFTSDGYRRSLQSALDTAHFTK
ncbi:FMN-binding protein [Kribbella koreensis]|uniref:FMN-binding protein n=2 Tax=Kribbella TaxID=182639 RepID=A0ABP6YW76_9ACTN